MPTAGTSDESGPPDHDRTTVTGVDVAGALSQTNTDEIRS
jgi:hypothetical protein